MLFPNILNLLRSMRWRARPLATPTAGLAALGLADALLYWFGITARYPLPEGLQHLRAGWATLMHYSLRAGLLHATVYLLLVASYMLAMRLALRLDAHQTRGAVIVIVGVWLICSASLLGAYPGESFDIFDYLFRGRMMVEYGASPLATAPVEFNTRPFYAYLTWRGQVDTYGPLWEYASAAVAWTVHYAAGRADSQIAYILGYRMLAISLAGLCGVFVAAIVRRAAPQHALAALVAWLWNPLLLITTAIGAHNDIIMVLAILVSFWLLQRQRWVLGLMALALAAHVKLTALLILPIVGLWLLRRCGWLRCIGIGTLTLALALPLSWLLYAPLGGWATLRRMLQERARLLINSPADLVYRLLQERYGWAEPAAWRITTLGATLLFFAIAAGVLVWFWSQNHGLENQESVVGTQFSNAISLDKRTRAAGVAFGIRLRQQGTSPFFVLSFSRAARKTEHLNSKSTALPKAKDADCVSCVNNELLWRASTALTLVYLLAGSFWFQHWYLLWLLAPVVLLPASRWALTLLPIYCLGALWNDLTNSFLRNIPGHPLTATQVGAANVLAQVTPLLLVLVVARVWRVRSRALTSIRNLLSSLPAVPKAPDQAS